MIIFNKPFLIGKELEKMMEAIFNIKSKHLWWKLLLSIYIIVSLTYSNHFFNPFHFDDFHTITSNEYIRDLGNTFLFFSDAGTTSSHPSNQTYRPFTTLTLAVDYWLGDGFETTFFFHLSVFIWYLIIITMIFLMVKKIADISFPSDYNVLVAWFAAIWFGVLTSNAETINYIISRTDVISAAMIIIGLIIFAYFPGKRRYYLFMIPVVLGMFAKETTAVFPGIILTYLILFEFGWSLKQSLKLKNFLKALGPVILPLIICGVLSVFVIKMISKSWYVGDISRFEYLITQFFVIVHYFNTFFLPFNLSADTDWVRITNVFDDRVIIGLVFIVFLLYVAFRTSEKKESRPISFGILWFLISLLPTSSIVPLSEVMNDHRIFLPFIGLMIAVCWMIYLLLKKGKEVFEKKRLLKYGVAVFFICLLLAHIYGTRQRNMIWSSDEALWRDVTIKSPNNGRGLMNYGLNLMGRGDYAGAQECFEKALTLVPYYSYLHINMAILKSAQGKDDEARLFFEKGIQYSPNNPEHRYFYAEWLKKQNRVSEAIAQLEKAVQASPGHTASKKRLHELLSVQGKSNLEIAEERVQADPSPGNYINLSLEYYNAKKFDECIKACEDALKLKPDYDIAYNNICSSYNSMKQWDKAIEACEKGSKINPSNQLIKNNLKLAKEEKEKEK